MSTFRPSEAVRWDYRNSVFQNGEKEAVAAFLVTFLVEKGDEWKEVAGGDLLKHMQREDIKAINPFYFGMAAMFGGQVVNAILRLEAEGYLTIRREENKEFFISATEKMLAFYASYAS